MQHTNATPLSPKALFNPNGDTDVRRRRLIGGNTTNLNDFNNVRYAWTTDWYRQAMNNFWIPEEINLSQDAKDYPNLTPAERTAYDKILSFLVFLDSLQTANLPNVGEFVTANEVNLCLHIQTFQECVHSQSYSYMLDTICSPEQRNDILYQWRTDGEKHVHREPVQRVPGAARRARAASRDDGELHPGGRVLLLWLHVLL